MKYMTFENGGTVTGLVTVNGLTMTGPLKLLSVATETNHAVNKEYVDNAVTVLNASYITSGTLPVGRFPGMTGDVVSVAGSGVILLKNTGVVPGTHCKVTVASTGLITKGETLSVSDIPTLSFNKITTNKPTTLAGYGITDGVSRNGGVIDGNLTLVGDPVTPTDLVTKQYADLSLAGRQGYAVGDIIRYSGNLTPSGFLKCNGGEISKAAYPELYSVIGNAFNYDTLGYGKPWSNLYGIDNSTAPLINDVSGPELPFDIYNTLPVVTKNRVFLFFGNATSNPGQVHHNKKMYLTASVNAQGDLGSWSTQEIPMATETRASRIMVAVYRNKVYVFKTNNLYVGTVQSNGTIGNWVIDSTVDSGTVTLAYASANIYKNIMYIGARYWFRIRTDGGLEGPFSISTAGLPGGPNNSATFIIKDLLYYMYQYGSSDTTVLATNRLNSDGTPGIWTYRIIDDTFSLTNNLFIRTNEICIDNKRATINPDGTIGNFTIRENYIDFSDAIFRVAGKVYFRRAMSDNLLRVYNVPGGTSDYMSYIDGTAGDLLRPNTFILPDFKTDGTSYQYYIKY